MLPTAVAEAAENQSGKSIDIPVEITAEGALPADPETYVVCLTKQVENAPMPEGTEGASAELQMQCPGEGVFTLVYTKPGVYLYQITQKAGSKTNCTYDTASYDLYMYVTNSGDGGLDINAYMENGNEEGKPEKAVFHNIYTGTAKFNPPIKKVVDVKNGKAPENSVFSFRITPEDPSYPMPENQKASRDSATGALTMDFKGPGSFELGWMSFDQSHCGQTFIYTVEEIDNAEAGYSYDKNIYRLTIKVLPSENGISLQTYVTDDSGEVSEMVFTNTYESKDGTPKKENPKKTPGRKTPSRKPSSNNTPDKSNSNKSRSKVKTGDDNNVLLWISIAGISLITVMSLLFLQKKNREE
jgi:pilin isopeptide linkage protein